MLREQDSIRLYAPAQAVSTLQNAAGPDADAVFDRVIGLAIGYGDDPVDIQVGELVIGAAHVPHAGWPTRTPEVQNIAFRVSFEGRIPPPAQRYWRGPVLHHFDGTTWRDLF